MNSINVRPSSSSLSACALHKWRYFSDQSVIFCFYSVMHQLFVFLLLRPQRVLLGPYVPWVQVWETQPVRVSLHSFHLKTEVEPLYETLRFLTRKLNALNSAPYRTRPSHTSPIHYFTVAALRTAYSKYVILIPTQNLLKVAHCPCSCLPHTSSTSYCCTQLRVSATYRSHHQEPIIL